MQDIAARTAKNHAPDDGPMTLPMTVRQYETLVGAGEFSETCGQTELIHGRVVHMNPQGPEHADPVDFLAEWSIEQVQRRFSIRIEKPVRFVDQNSVPEPDIIWASRRRYLDRHPNADEVKLVMEVSKSSLAFDRGEKMSLYASVGIPEYWQFDVTARTVTVFRDPAPKAYRSSQVFGINDKLSPVCLPEAELSIKDVFG